MYLGEWNKLYNFSVKCVRRYIPMAASYESILQDLKNKKYSPIYLLMGEETFFMDQITEYIATHVLNEEEKAFNYSVLYGKDSDAATIINTAKRFPMMAPFQVVILKEAQSLKDIDNLIYYVQKPQNSTILVINYKYGKLNKTKKLYKALAKSAVVFESDKLYEDRIPAWINVYLKSKGVKIKPEAAMVLVEFLGSNLSKIAAELDKLILTLPNKETDITRDHIEKNIGISKDFNNFELQKALAKKNSFKAMQIADYFDKNPKDNPIVVTITSLYFYFSKLLAYHFLPDKSKGSVAGQLKINPYFVGEYAAAARQYKAGKVVKIISLLREYDLKSKGFKNSSVSHGELLRELIFKIMH